MFKRLFHFPDDMTRQARTVFGAVALMAGVLALGLVLFAYQARQTTGYTPQFWMILITGIVVVICQLISLRVTWQGRHELGVWLAFLPWLILLLMAGASLAEIGLPLMAVAIIPVLALVAGQVMPARRSSILVIVSIVDGILILVANWLLPIKLMAVPGFATIAYILVLVLIVAFVFILFWQFPTYSLRTKQLVSLLNVSLVVMVIFGVVTYMTTRAHILSDLGESLQTTADLQGRIMGDFLGKEVDLLTSLRNRLRTAAVNANSAYAGSTADIQSEIQELDAQWIAADQAGNDRDPLVASHLNNATAEILREYRQEFSENVEVFLTDRYGAIVGSTNRTSDYNQADEVWWQTAYNNGSGRIYIGEMEYDESSQAYATIIAVPLHASDSDQVIGVLRTTVTTQSAVDYLNLALQESEGTHTDILFPNGSILTENGLEEVALSEQNVLRAVAPPYLELAYHGEPSFLYTSPVLSDNPDVDNAGWLVIVHQHRQVALAPLDSQLRVITVVGLALAGLAAAIAFLLARSLTKPVIELTGIAEKVAAGDLTVEAKVETGDEIGQLAGTFNSMTRQIRELIGTLEQRVAARTKDLATVAEVGTATATVLETRKLLQSVVDLTKERFDLYHSHIYLLDETGENLLLTSGAGEAGRQMVAEKRTIPLDSERSLVARAARERKGVIVNDVTQTPDFLPNPLLPDTRSELAVPMIVGGSVIGVFDVQSDQVGRFTDSDANIQTTLAAQVAVSVQNVRLFERSKTQADLEFLVNTIGQKIQKATSVQDTLQTAVREIGLALGASRVSASIGTSRQPEGDETARS